MKKATRVNWYNGKLEKFWVCMETGDMQGMIDIMNGMEEEPSVYAKYISRVLAHTMFEEGARLRFIADKLNLVYETARRYRNEFWDENPSYKK